jgi:hypothetical protein
VGNEDEWREPKNTGERHTCPTLDREGLGDVKERVALRADVSSAAELLKRMTEENL